MTKTVLTTENLTIGYRHRRKAPTVVARNLSLSLREGEVVCLIGPNGVGKSTLMRTMTGLQPGLSGEVVLEDSRISDLAPGEMARRIGVVLTERVNVGMLSGFALAALGRHPHTGWSGRLTEEDIQAVHWAISAVGAENLTWRLVSELSDGERQKIMIARALAQEPHTIVLDEPTAYLDLPRRVEIMGLLRSLARNTGKAILLSTHDLDLALRSADLIWLMYPGGNLKEGAPEDLVLSGALEEAFANEGVEFDREHGAFVLARRLGKKVGLQGDGIASFWTRRALEREGFLVLPQDEQEYEEAVRVTVQNEDSGPVWRTCINEEFSDHSSIYQMVRYLRIHLNSESS